MLASYIKDLIVIRKKNITGSEQNIFSELNVLTQSDYPVSDGFGSNLVFYQFGWIVYYGIIVVGIIFALVHLGFDIGAILTILATLGLALGLALQETLKNIISGVYLAIANPFGLNDLISLKSLGSINPLNGRVIDFNLYYTSIIDLKTNNITVIPNSTIQNNLVTNLSRNV